MADTARRDLKGSRCTHCRRGTFAEATLQDSGDETLHCTHCRLCIDRYVEPAPRFVVYADGSCKANGARSGGRGGWGAVICDTAGATLHELSGAEAGTTNNRMELLAVLRALETLPDGSEVEIWTDSQYVVKGMTEWLPGWKRRGWLKPDGAPVLNRELWQDLEQATIGVAVSWHWVRGHSGHPGNERADTLAQAAAVGRS